MLAITSRSMSTFASRCLVLRSVVALSVFGAALSVPFASVAEQTSTGNHQTEAAHRTPAQIRADIVVAFKALPNYPMEAQLDPRYRAQMDRELSAPLQHLVDLYTELEKADPVPEAGAQSEKNLALVRLALYGHADAMRSLNDASQSSVASTALAGKLGLMMYRWWNSADAATQQGIVAEFKTLAKANSREDMMVPAALDMARYNADSDEIASSLRDLVDHDLNGPAAEKYHHQPFKIGRPFKLAVNSVGGKEVATSDWKGEVVLIDFWATWCPPCRAALPNLVQLYQTNHSKGLEVLGISNDSSLPTLRDFLAGNKGMVWPESFNPTGPDGWNGLSPQMGVHSIPTTFFIDRNGVLRDIQVGFLDEEVVKKLLDETPQPQLASSAPASPVIVNELSSAPTTKPAGSIDLTERQADSMLALANSYVSANRPDRAKDKLIQLLDKYPNTSAAPKARDLLAQLNAQ
jgi:thiol-disulfide isomerase/thioredoxin